MLKVTFHAGERFLQRVFKYSSYTKNQVFDAMKLISKDIKNIHFTRNRFVLPSFPEFLCITQNNKVVTIIPKA